MKLNKEIKKAIIESAAVGIAAALILVLFIKLVEYFLVA